MRAVDEAKHSDVPPGAPEAVYLYADYRSEELRTLIYLCNSTPEPLSEGIVRISSTTLFQFITCEAGGDANFSDATDVKLPTVNPGERVLVNELSHEIWDFVCRYELTFNKTPHRRERFVAYDRTLNASRLAENQRAAWVVFCKG